MKKNRTRERDDTGKHLSRRKFIAASGIVAAGGMLANNALASVAARNETASITAPPLPWAWAKLDPQEVGERTFKNYHEKGG